MIQFNKHNKRTGVSCILRYAADFMSKAIL